MRAVELLIMRGREDVKGWQMATVIEFSRDMWRGQLMGIAALLV
jgi:hypothetical protein